ncbi:MAG: FAD binding domain-containing protein [Gammaproteobacteria bacterium]|nr:FAD binding domain-containing protein [Gammaproteobacteria bacterium]
MLRLPEFEYAAPTTVAEATRLLHERGTKAMLLAGGTDLIPNLKRRQFRPELVVALHKVEALRGIQERSGRLVIGPLATLAEVAAHPAIRSQYPALANAAAMIGTPQLRNQGTLGGNLFLNTRCSFYNQLEEWRNSDGSCLKAEGGKCQVAPGGKRCWAVSSSDTAPVLAALGAELRLVRHDDERMVPVAALYRDDGINYLAVQPGEMLTEVLLPVAGTWDRTAFLKLRRRGTFDFPILNVAGAVKFGAGNVVERISVMLGAVGSTPMAIDAQKLFAGKPLDNAAATAALQTQAGKRATPLPNTDASHVWRKRMVRVYTARILKELAT